MVASIDAVRTDEELVALVAQGDKVAFAELYDRHADAVTDFTIRMVRDQEAAADVVQSAFVTAWERIKKGDEPRQFKAWLYTIVRNRAIDEIRQRKFTANTTDENNDKILYAEVDANRMSNPQPAAQNQELAELVWGAASALSPSEYSLLDMHLRQDMDAEEIGEALGMEKASVYVKLSRLRASLEEAVTASVLVRRGRQDCPKLDELLVGHPIDELTRDMRTLVARHLKACETCKENKRRLLSPAAIFAGLGVVAVVPAMKSGIWEGIVARTTGAAAETDGSGDGNDSGSQDQTASTPKPGAETAAQSAMSSPLARLFTSRRRSAAMLFPPAGVGVFVAVVMTLSGGPSTQYIEAAQPVADDGAVTVSEPTVASETVAIDEPVSPASEITETDEPTLITEPVVASEPTTEPTTEPTADDPIEIIDETIESTPEPFVASPVTTDPEPTPATEPDPVSEPEVTAVEEPVIDLTAVEPIAEEPLAEEPIVEEPAPAPAPVEPVADTTPPAAPSGTSALAGDSTIVLNWFDNGEADLAGYNVYRATTSGGPYARLNGALLSSSAFSDAGLTNGTTYYYVVTAVDADGNESAYSIEVSATPFAAAAPAPAPDPDPVPPPPEEDPPPPPPEEDPPSGGGGWGT